MRAFFRNLGMYISTVGELLGGLWRGPYWWLVPMIVTLLPFSALFIFLQAFPAVAPFVYTLF